MNERFDLATSAMLAAYAFEAYNEPANGKAALGTDGTSVIFTSSEFIRKAFSAVALVTVIRAKLTGNIQEEMLDAIATGSSIDPYVKVAVLEATGSTRVLDSATTRVKMNENNPVYQETFLLYVASPETANLSFTVYDRDVFSSDDWVGEGSVSIAECLRELSKDSLLQLPVPLYTRHSQRKRVGTVEVRVELVPWSQQEESSAKKFGIPKGAAILECNWPSLINKVIKHRHKLQPGDYALLAINESLPGLKLSDKLHQICFVESEETDTQAAVFADINQRRLIVSFRGTEQIKYKDLLTDINLLQCPITLDEGKKLFVDVEDRAAAAHCGFLNAYRSVRAAIFQIFDLLFSIDCENKGPWTIYVTGHSLGGALATLFSFELGRMISYSSEKPQLSIRTYLYGAPRVGNRVFAKLYNQYVPYCYRITNRRDIVPRLPRSFKLSEFEYTHIGKTVMLQNKESVDTPELWIEGEAGNICPLEDSLPVVSGISSSEALESLKSFLNKTSSSAVDGIMTIASDLLKSAMNPKNSIFKTLPNSFEQYSDFLQQLIAAADEGSKNDFLDREIELLSTLIRGTAVEHHLEPSYFTSFNSIIEKSIGNTNLTLRAGPEV